MGNPEVIHAGLGVVDMTAQQLVDLIEAVFKKMKEVEELKKQNG